MQNIMKKTQSLSNWFRSDMERNRSTVVRQTSENTTKVVGEPNICYLYIHYVVPHKQEPYTILNSVVPPEGWGHKNSMSKKDIDMWNHPLFSRNIVCHQPTSSKTVASNIISMPSSRSSNGMPGYTDDDETNSFSTSASELIRVDESAVGRASKTRPGTTSLGISVGVLRQDLLLRLKDETIRCTVAVK
jgi:hypothetical protein